MSTLTSLLVVLPKPSLAQDFANQLYSKQTMRGDFGLSQISHESQKITPLQRWQLFQARDAKGAHTRSCLGTFKSLSCKQLMQHAYNEAQHGMQCWPIRKG